MEIDSNDNYSGLGIVCGSLVLSLVGNAMQAARLPVPRFEPWAGSRVIQTNITHIGSHDCVVQTISQSGLNETRTMQAYMRGTLYVFDGDELIFEKGLSVINESDKQ